MAKQRFISRFKNDALFRNKFTLICTTIWNILVCIYYFLVGWLDSKTFSWFYGLTIWFGILVIFKIILLSKISKLEDKRKIDFNSLMMVYLIINMFEIFAITLTPVFVTNVFANKIKGFTFGSLAISIVNLVLFIISFIPVNKKQLNENQNGFIRAKSYYGRTEGFFNILLIAINILVVVKVKSSILAYVYLGVGWSFIIMCIILTIKLSKERKNNKKEG